MGIMPHYDPLHDVSLAWAVARVLRCEPETATWGRPSSVHLTIERALRGALPPAVTALFDAPREAEQERFYAVRGASPEAASRALAELDARAIPLPPVGARVIVWLAAPAAPPPLQPAPDGPQPPPPPGAAVLPQPPAGGWWTVPSPRLMAAHELPFASRWIEHSDATEAAVRARLGAPA
ncbi:MAG: hypothetical protein R3A48_17105 [Polyangiales bacterium]